MKKSPAHPSGGNLTPNKNTLDTAANPCYNIVTRGGVNMTNNELCILLESLLALLETNNDEKAIIVIKNAIQRIDKNALNNEADKKD